MNDTNPKANPNPTHEKRVFSRVINPSNQELPKTSLGFSWVGLGGTVALSLTRRNGSGQEVFIYRTGRFGSPRPGPTRSARGDPAREMPWGKKKRAEKVVPF